MKHGLAYALSGLVVVGCSGSAGIVGSQTSTVEVARPIVAALSPIYFGAGATALGPEQMKLLDAHAISLRRGGNQVLLIEGHTDGPARHRLSIEIGEERARSTRAYLVSKGVAAVRLAFASYGGDRPICMERTTACRASNRRVTFSTKPG
jgi:peptidoglycan-associated lipoprotein